MSIIVYHYPCRSPFAAGIWSSTAHPKSRVQSTFRGEQGEVAGGELQLDDLHFVGLQKRGSLEALQSFGLGIRSGDFPGIFGELGMWEQLMNSQMRYLSYVIIYFGQK